MFVGPVEIAGYYGRLAQGLRDIGVDAVAVDLTSHRFKYASTGRVPLWVRAAMFAERRWSGSRRLPSLLRLPWWILRGATRLGLLAWSVPRFDAFIFGYGTTLLFGRDLPLLRLLGKRLVFMFNGSDARPPYIDGADMAASRHTTVDECIRLAARKKALIRRVERYADAIVCLSTASHFFERPIVDHLRIGAPSMPVKASQPRPMDDEEIRILHSPSDPEVKGSDRIRSTVEAMRAAGHPLRLIELRNVPNDTVAAEIARADFVIDQLYSDTPMAVFVAEAAAAGVPAIVGSYAWPELHRLYSGDELPPVEECHPDELEAAVRRLAEDPPYRADLGARAREFVQTQWATTQIAERYLAILRGDVPAEWLFQPSALRYVEGVGLPEERARQIVSAVLATGGREALQLGDKPALEQAFVDFAAGP